MFEEILGIFLESAKESLPLGLDDRVVLRDCVLVEVLVKYPSMLPPSVAVWHDRETPVRVYPE
jgi:hypothetical protein